MRTRYIALTLFALTITACSGSPAADKPDTEAVVATEADVTTEAPATNEPEPTATERPTEDPEAAAVREYMDWGAPFIAQIGKAIGDISNNLGQAVESPAIILTDDWRRVMALQLQLLSAGAEVIRTKPQTEVPEPVTKLHGQMLELAGNLDSISTNLTDGIDNLDESKISAATEAMTSSSSLIAEMAVEVEALKEKYGTD